MASNVNIDAFIPAVWDASILRTLEDNLVGRKICRVRPQGEVKKHGDTVHFNGLADPTINTYSGTVSYETLKSGQLTLLINQQKYYAFEVEDVEQAMANIDAQGSQASRAAYGLALDADDYIMTLYSDATIEVDDDSCDTATILSDLALCAQGLKEANVKAGDMWIVIPPWIQTKLELAGIKFSINEGINGTGGMDWAKVLGLDVYVSNNVYATSGPVSYCMFGSYNAIVFADALVKSRVMELEDSFAVGVSGLHVYGAKVIKPKELGRFKATYSAESAI